MHYQKISLRKINPYAPVKYVNAYRKLAENFVIMLLMIKRTENVKVCMQNCLLIAAFQVFGLELLACTYIYHFHKKKLYPLYITFKLLN